jgi:hypothetical protein
MKRIKNSNRTTMRQDGIESISLLMIAADMLRQMSTYIFILASANEEVAFSGTSIRLFLVCVLA